MTAGQTEDNVTRPKQWHTPTPQERARDRCPRSELLVIDHAGEITEQLELACLMLSVAVEVIATLTNRYRDQVVDAIEAACQ